MLNLGIVGLGKWGQRHVDSAIASGRFRVVRAVTGRPDRAAEFAAARSIAVTDSLENLLADPLVDAISLATPHTLHASQIMRGAAAGKHVLAEKPFTLTKAEAEKAVAACTKAEIVVAVGHDNRFYPAIVELKRLVDAGTLGSILHAEANLSREGSIKLAGKTAASAPSTGWRLDGREAPGGVIAHLGIHRLDSFVQLFGKIDRVFAQASHVTPNAPFADSVNVLVRFRSGMTGYLGSSLATTLNSRFQVFGSHGWLELRGPCDMQEYLRTSLRSVSIRLNDGQTDTREFDAVDSVKLNFEAFADAIEGKVPYPVPVDEMIHVVAVVEAVARSLETGQPAFV